MRAPWGAQAPASKVVCLLIDITYMKTIDNATLKAARELVDYMYTDERDHYEEEYDELPEYTTAAVDLEEITKRDKAHIFNDVCRLAAFLEAKPEPKTPHVSIEPFNSPRSNKPVANQWVIKTDDGEFFQSYQSIIAFRPNTAGMFPHADGSEEREDRIVLDEKYWDYSTTTGKYRNEFLGEDKAETKKKIANGTYTFADLNQGK